MLLEISVLIKSHFLHTSFTITFQRLVLCGAMRYCSIDLITAGNGSYKKFAKQSTILSLLFTITLLVFRVLRNV